MEDNVIKLERVLYIRNGGYLLSIVAVVLADFLFAVVYVTAVNLVDRVDFWEQVRKFVEVVKLEQMPQAERLVVEVRLVWIEAPVVPKINIRAFRILQILG